MKTKNVTIWVMAIAILHMTGISSGNPVYLSIENIGLLPIREFYVGFDIAPPDTPGTWDFAVMTPGYEDIAWNVVMGDYTILPLDEPIAPGEIYCSTAIPQLEDLTFGVRGFGFIGSGYDVGWQSYYWEWTLDQSFLTTPEEQCPLRATLRLSTIPEPATLLLLGFGAVMLRKIADDRRQRTEDRKRMTDRRR